jgi:CPA1 family monovalent cation:H+ antiporter
VLVEGESLLNDATAIVVVGILLGLAAMTGTATQIAFAALGEFLFVFFGGVLVGTVFGLAISWLMSRFSQQTSAVLVLSLVLAYMSFVVAEHGLHVSGVMAVVACAIILGVFGSARLPLEVVEIMHETWEFIAHICNTLLFLFIGMLVDVDSLLNNALVILFAVLLVQASRASMVYSLVPVTERLFRLPHVTPGERHIMVWGGLKGGLAIAIVISLPVDLPGRDMLIDLTLGVVLFSLLVNAPTIRPLIRMLGLDRMTDDERAELKRGLTGAEQTADKLLERFSRYGLVSRANLHRVRERTDKTLEAWVPEVIGDDEFRHQRLNALRAEMTELDVLFRAGVLKQYVYLDLRGELQRKRDHIITEHRVGVSDTSGSGNWFLKVEDALVKWLREKDWAATLLSGYQNRRLSSRLMRDVVRILMSEAALNEIRNDDSIISEHRDRLERIYCDHLIYFRDHLKRTRSYFPEFVDRFETNMCARAAMVAAVHHVEQSYHNGGVTSKVYTWLEQRIQRAINELPRITQPVPGFQPHELVRMVPLLAGLPEEALQRIARHATTVNYLVGDTVIGTGEHGDALYVIARGRVEVLTDKDGERQMIAELGAGEFFGEMALLGDHVRTADVCAVTACTLLRIRSSDVHGLAHEYPEISERLNAARDARNANSG